MLMTHCQGWLQPLENQLNRIINIASLELLGHVLGTLLIVMVSLHQAPLALIVVWGLAQGFILTLRVLALLGYQQSKQHSAANGWFCHWGVTYLLGVFASGVMWGMSAFLLEHSVTPAYHAVLLSAVFVLAGAAILTLGAVLPLYLVFVLPMLLPVMAWLMWHPDSLYHALGIAALAYLLYTTIAARRLSQSLRKLQNQSEALLTSQREILLRLARAGEYRDNETGGHVQRMSQSCQLLALQAGLGEQFAEHILYASPMHDVGKIGISDQILLKPGKLDADEWAVMQTHVLIGQDILAGHSCEIVQMARRIAATHHERWDGTGYPYGLAGEAIPIEGRIAAICDVFDALTSPRPYKTAWSSERALAYIRAQAGKQFDPTLVEHFLAIAPSIVALHKGFPKDTLAHTHDLFTPVPLSHPVRHAGRQSSPVTR